MSAPAAAPMPAARDERAGFLYVFLAALCWSLGGVIARFIEAPDPWTVVFWRSLFAALFLLGFMLWRDGPRGTFRLFAAMGLPGLGVACCFAIATSSFVLALSYTTVANILLIQAGGPLFAALLAFALFGERVSAVTWGAVVAVIAGVAVMVSGSFSGAVSMVGDGLALAIVLVFSVATVLTRRFSHVRMTPAMCLGTAIAGLFAAAQASTFHASASDMGFLFAFGAVNLGLGLAFFATGARMIAAAYAALLATFETLLGPIWVWLVHGEVPAGRTLLGGAIVFAALLVHIGLEFRRLSRPQRPGVTGISAPH
ncbi:MAG: EamA family transporter [Hyphomicrobiales bacterium]|nr:MAG: EamA family transporter [Hyphomicrobiales bacterium]